MLGDIGGLSDAISILGSLIASIFSSHLFLIEQVHQIFKTRKGSLTHKKPMVSFENAFASFGNLNVERPETIEEKLDKKVLFKGLNSELLQQDLMFLVRDNITFIEKLHKTINFCLSYKENSNISSCYKKCCRTKQAKIKAKILKKGSDRIEHALDIQTLVNQA